MKISVSEFVYKTKNAERLMLDYSNMMSQLRPISNPEELLTQNEETL